MGIITIEAPGAEISDEARAALTEADIVTVVDVRTECEFTVFGTPPLESTQTLKRPAAMQVVQVRIDTAGGGLERLAKLVRDLKGRGR